MSTSDALPPWRSVLAVVAHPDDESFGLGAVLAAFVGTGTRVAVLCFTHGEASSLHGVTGELEHVRATELTAAARALELHQARLLGYPDAHLSDIDLETLAAHVVDMSREVNADGLLGFDLSGITGHPDHVRASAAALQAADTLDLPVLGWALPSSVATQLHAEHAMPFAGRPPTEIDLTVTVDRTTQLRAIACHPSQAVPGSVLWRRLEILGNEESLVWLRPSRLP